MKKQKNYDKKVKNTRILLADYLLLKSIAQNAGVSMSEALHTIITRDWAMAKRKARPVAVATKPAFIVKAPVILRTRPQPILTTNGHKAGVFVTKPKGGIIQ
ncbi:hypothetical protein ES705_46470 [subsurface metagenome]|jgi:hypothetical protein